jgi:hypothetical protein
VTPGADRMADTRFIERILAGQVIGKGVPVVRPWTRRRRGFPG